MTKSVELNSGEFWYTVLGTLLPRHLESGAPGSNTLPSGIWTFTGTINAGIVVVLAPWKNGLRPTITPVAVLPSRLAVTEKLHIGMVVTVAAPLSACSVVTPFSCPY